MWCTAFRTPTRAGTCTPPASCIRASCPIATSPSPRAPCCRMSTGCRSSCSVLRCWCVAAAPTERIRAGVLAVGAFAIGAMDYFVAGSVSAAKWNLLDYHQLTVVGQDVFGRIDDAVRHRIPEAARFYLAHILLVSTVLLAAIAWPTLRGWRRRSEVRAVALGLLLFEAGHLIAGEWHT